MIIVKPTACSLRRKVRYVMPTGTPRLHLARSSLIIRQSPVLYALIVIRLVTRERLVGTAVVKVGLP